MQRQPLNPEEERVMIHKGTEPPFSGQYYDFYESGGYTCRRCGAYVFRSADKFDSGCGWPSFDDEIPGAVKRASDADGQRVEILCARCGAHFGHVFHGEGFTPKDTRHCVNSVSLVFVPEDKILREPQTACFGGGCFWCTEAVFLMAKGVSDVQPGYAGGDLDNPGYEQVCRGDTGHAEAVRMTFDPLVMSYEGLLEIFFASHDPASFNRQGADIGSQYRSVIFYTGGLQREIAEMMIRDFNLRKVFSGPVVTAVEPLKKFYPAEEYHQDYFARNAGAPYCQAVVIPKILKLRENYKKYLK